MRKIHAAEKSWLHFLCLILYLIFTILEYKGKALKGTGVIMKMIQMMEMEYRMQKELEKIKNDLAEEIKKNSAKCDQEGAPNICTVNFKDLENTILSPSYYHPRQQAKIVKTKLDMAKTPSEFVKFAKEMVSTKQVVCGKSKELLNPKTIKIISEYLERV